MGRNNRARLKLIDPLAESCYHFSNAHRGEAHLKTIYVRALVFPLIRSGKKSIEIRSGRSLVRDLQRGDELKIATSELSLIVRVVRIDRYDTLKDALDQEDVEKIAPGFSKIALNSYLGQIYGPKDEKLGIYAIEYILL